MLIPIIILCLVILIFLDCYFHWSGNEITVLSSVFIVAMLITYLVWGLVNIGHGAEMEAFYYANESNYAATTQETKEILTLSREKVMGLIPIEGSIEKFQHSEEVSKRIAEHRDAINKYNRDLQKFRTYDKLFLTNILYPTLPEELKLIKIE